MSNTPLHPTDEANIPLTTVETVEPANRYDYSPRPFKEIPLLWLKIFKMDAAFFKNEIRHTSMINTLLGVLLFSCLNFVLIYLSSYFNNTIISTSEHLYTQFHWKLEYSQTSIPFVSLIGLPLVYYLGSFIHFLSAKLLKGIGTFTEQIYLDSLYSPLPYFIRQIAIFFQYTFQKFYLTALFIPLLIFLAYMMIVRIRAYKIVHQFSTGKAVLVMFIPSIFLLSLMFILGVLSSIIEITSQG